MAPAEPEPAAAAGTSGTGPSAAEAAVAAQLHRLTAYDASTAAYVTAVHDGLLERGYIAKVPRQRSTDSRATYLRYVDGATGVAIGGLNSSRFTFTRAALKARLAGNALVDVGPRYARVRLRSEDAVRLVLSVAEDERAGAAA